MDLAAGELPDEPGLDRAEGDLAALRFLTDAVHILKDPADLGAGEIGVDEEAGAALEELFQALCLQFLTVIRGAAVLPDDGAVNGVAGLPVPHDDGLALVRDADCGNVLGRGFRLRKRFARDGIHRKPDLFRVMLDPAGFREILGEFPLLHFHDAALLVEQDAAVRGRSGVQRHQHFFHSFPP